MYSVLYFFFDFFDTSSFFLFSAQPYGVRKRCEEEKRTNYVEWIAAHTRLATSVQRQQIGLYTLAGERETSFARASVSVWLCACDGRRHTWYVNCAEENKKWSDRLVTEWKYERHAPWSDPRISQCIHSFVQHVQFQSTGMFNVNHWCMRKFHLFSHRMKLTMLCCWYMKQNRKLLRIIVNNLE